MFTKEEPAMPDGNEIYINSAGSALRTKVPFPKIPPVEKPGAVRASAAERRVVPGQATLADQIKKQQEDGRRVSYLACLLSNLLSKPALTTEERLEAVVEAAGVLSGDTTLSKFLFASDGSTAFAALIRAEEIILEQKAT